jgi:hypothetical protein
VTALDHTAIADVPRLSWSIPVTLRDPLLLALLAAGVGARLLALGAWPFVVEGDGADYLERLVAGRSSLLQAAGYAFFLQPLAWVAALTGADVAAVLRHTLPWLGLASLVVLYLSLRPLLGRVVPAAVCVLLAVDPLELAAASTSRPEHLQACWWTLVLAACAHCLTSTTRPGTRPHALLGVCLGAAFVTKFNSVALTPLALAAVLAGATSMRQRAQRSLALVGGFGAVLALFLSAFHRPTTGTWSLNLGVGWHRMCNLTSLGVHVEPDAGPATRLAHRIALELPAVPVGAGAFAHLHAVPREVRRPYLERWRPLLDDPGASADDTSCTTAPRAAPPLDLRDGAAFCRLYHFLGLEPAERLLGAVYVEALRRDPGDVWRGVLTRLDDGVRLERQYEPYLPVACGGASRTFAGPRAAVLRLGDAPREDVHRAMAPHVWADGAAVLGALGWLPRLPTELVWAALAAGVLRHAFWRRGGSRAGAWLALGCLTSVVALQLFSLLTLTFRVKELIAVMPLLALGLALPFARTARRSPAPAASIARPD